MKNKFLLTCMALLYMSLVKIYAQTTNMFYGTIQTEDAVKLKKLAPNDIKIIASRKGFSAVKLSDKAAEKLHHMVLTHGPGFIFETSKQEALNTIRNHQLRRKQRKTTSFSISENQAVQKSIALAQFLPSTRTNLLKP